MKRQHVISLILALGMLGIPIMSMGFPALAGEVKSTGKEPKKS